MNLLISGASGLIGSALASHLAAEGHRVARLVRGRPCPGAGDVGWDPAVGRLHSADLAGTEAVVHLAGEGIASGRWSAARKERIRQSRVEGTRLLAASLAGLHPLPRVLACASAVGYYGDRGNELLSEDSGPGDGFLAAVCRDWEEAADPARAAGIRLVHLRFGMVLSREGGALARMLPAYRAGLGGRLGHGGQYHSWIALDDVVGALRFLLEADSTEGPCNLVAPSPVTNAQFARSLGRVLHRPALLPVPAWLLRLMLGEMAGALLLASARVRPARLLAGGYRFQYPELDGALRHLLSADPRS